MAGKRQFRKGGWVLCWMVVGKMIGGKGPRCWLPLTYPCFFTRKEATEEARELRARCPHTPIRVTHAMFRVPE